MQNDMGHVKAMQGRWNPDMASCDDTPLWFKVPESGHVMLMAQCTALCAQPDGGNHEVGVVFELWLGEHCDALVTSHEARVKGLHPGHGTVCMAYLANGDPLAVGEKAKVVIRASDDTPGGTVTPEDFFSVSVVELEHSADIASFTGGRADEASKGE